jgi:hypothetical protein
MFPLVNLTGTDKLYSNIPKKSKLKLKEFYKITGKSESKRSNKHKHVRSGLTCPVLTCE